MQSLLASILVSERTCAVHWRRRMWQSTSCVQQSVNCSADRMVRGDAVAVLVPTHVVLQRRWRCRHRRLSRPASFMIMLRQLSVQSAVQLLQRTQTLQSFGRVVSRILPPAAILHARIESNRHHHATGVGPLAEVWQAYAKKFVLAACCLPGLGGDSSAVHPSELCLTLADTTVGADFFAAAAAAAAVAAACYADVLLSQSQASFDV
mmetsp:Transcript_62333/g.123181  ORF Transcript_62333/g.123181 Transcript_62333/m.123181 type:complete len:207 (+) Transcript_62333:527-1147(+)